MDSTTYIYIWYHSSSGITNLEKENFMCEKKYLTPKELEKRWGIKRGTLAHWRAENRGAKYVLIEGAVRYPLNKVEEYEENAKKQEK